MPEMPAETPSGEQFNKAEFDKIWIRYEEETAKEEAALADTGADVPLTSSGQAVGPAQDIEVTLNEHIKEELEYLDSIFTEYERFVSNIGRLGYTAAMLLYYRDDIQDSMNFLRPYADLKEYWKKLVYLDNTLRYKTGIFVKEVGYNNFKQYQIINDPPKLHWWWYLNKQVSAPPPEKRWWQIWK